MDALLILFSVQNDHCRAVSTISQRAKLIDQLIEAPNELHYDMASLPVETTLDWGEQVRQKFGLILVVICLGNLLAVSFADAQALIDPTLTDEDNFGFAVAINQQFIVVGDRRDDTTGNNVGRVQVFRTSTGAFLRSYDDPTPSIQDNFGSAVGADTQHVIVGAPQDATLGPLVGQAYLYSINSASGQPRHTFNEPTANTADFFGSAVDVDGDFAVVGSPGDDSQGFGVGQAHVFNVETGELVHTLLDPTPTGFDSFGTAVAIEGDFVLVGEPGDDGLGFGVGSAHLFSASTGDFIRSFNDPTPLGSDEFGFSVALSDQLALIGAPGDDTFGENVGQAYLFDLTSGSILQTYNDPQPSIEDDFGRSVSVSGQLAMIGAPNSQDANGINTGQAFLFETSSDQAIDTLNPPNSQTFDFNGQSVAIFEDVGVVGSPCHDSSGTNNGRATRFELGQVLKGDVNLDGSVDLLDIAPFVDILSTGKFQPEADVNCNGVVDLLDVGPLVDLIVG